ncbi:hypothetical protein N7510_002150 [Penicillium lagena]|uniref:uncharacterized protein n=1 Tax=Penicillium lagena TaxID=94218 RepID=UPI00253FDC30|nr:uncharacterized protein N7510_002150 [Penicillium lagena]KAJ5625841.1 hypothetical protein N7510_002150 [Penicillium lagena]
MDKEERLKLLFKEDQELLNRALGLKFPICGVSPEALAPAKASADVSVSYDWMTPMEVPLFFTSNDIAPLSYIRSRVTGVDQLDNQDHSGQAILPTVDQNDSTSHELEAVAHLDNEAIDVDSSTQGPGWPSDVTLAESFCPVVALSRFPYRYLRGEMSQKVASRFFDGNKFWNRHWDLYFLYVPPNIYHRPLLLVPALQAKALLTQINAFYHCQLCFEPRDQRGLLLSFPNDGTPRPIYLDKSTSRHAKEQLELSIPAQPDNWGEWVNKCDPEAAKAFEMKVEAAIEAIKQKKRATAKKLQKQFEIEQEWRNRLQLTIAHFGLRPPIQEAGGEKQYLPPVNVYRPVPWPFEDEPIFIAIDIEWNERIPEQVTEVGISMLDTLDLKGLPPGDFGTDWIKQIHSRHFRIIEFRHIINKEYCKGCPDRFDFGKSEFIALVELPTMVDACFVPPYSASKDRFGAVPEYRKGPRKVILVGHNPVGDLKHLRDAGCAMFTDAANNEFFDNRKVYDTAKLFKSLRGETGIRSLKHILHALNILSMNLHNAGNDAHFTLEALIRMVLEESGETSDAGERRI